MAGGKINVQLSKTPNVDVSLNATDDNIYKKEFTSIIQQYFDIKKCLIDRPNGHSFSFEKYDEMNAYGMICPQCVKNQRYVKCDIHITNQNIMEIIEEYTKNTAKLNDDLEFEILSYLKYNSDRAYSASEIALNLDCSYQLITKRADKLIARELLSVDKKKSKERRYFLLTDYAKKMLDIA